MVVKGYMGIHRDEALGFRGPFCLTERGSQ